MSALNILRENIHNLELEDVIFPICANIKYFHVSKRIIPNNMKISTIMNPPFGVKKRGADRIFLEKAFSISDVVYSIHLANEKVRKFITNFVKKFKWKIDNVLHYNMILERSFQFHTHKTKKIDVDVYRFVKNRNH